MPRCSGPKLLPAQGPLAKILGLAIQIREVLRVPQLLTQVYSLLAVAPGQQQPQGGGRHQHLLQPLLLQGPLDLAHP